MTDHVERSDDQQTLGALYALGILDAQEAAAFEAQMNAGDQKAIEAWQAFDRIVKKLGYEATPVAPPTTLRERLLARLPMSPAQPQATTATPPSPSPVASESLLVVRAHEGSWQVGPSPGLSIKRLSHDATRQYVTQLLHIAPGAYVPRHQHADVEEMYVLAGSCYFDDQTFRAGDYVRMPAGSIHNPVTSETGCLLMIIGSTRSQLLTT